MKTQTYYSKINKYYLVGIFASVIWSFLVIALRQLKNHSSEEILLGRIFFSSIIAIIISSVFLQKKITHAKKTFENLSKKDKVRNIFYIVLSGILLGSNWYVYVLITNQINIRSASLVYIASPIITAALGFIILKEKVNTYKIVSIGIAIISLSILARENILNTLFVITCASFYSIFVLIQKKIVQVNPFILITTYLSVVTLIMLTLRFNEYKNLLNSMDFHFIKYIILISIVFTLFPMALSLYSLSGITTSASGIIVFINPIGTFLISKFIYDETLVLSESIAYCLIFVTIIIFNWKELNVFLKKKESF